LAIASILLIGFIIFCIFNYYLQRQLIEIYNKQNSLIIQDRIGKTIFIEPNEKGYWAEYLDKIPPRFSELLAKKEDKYFYYYYFGFNPWFTFQAELNYFGLDPGRASSAINQ